MYTLYLICRLFSASTNISRLQQHTIKTVAKMIVHFYTRQFISKCKRTLLAVARLHKGLMRQLVFMIVEFLAFLSFTELQLKFSCIKFANFRFVCSEKGADQIYGFSSVQYRLDTLPKKVNVMERNISYGSEDLVKCVIFIQSAAAFQPRTFLPLSPRHW